MLDQKELKRQFHYDPETGQFTRLVKMGKGAKIGPVNPRPMKLGYLRLRIGNVLYLSHRLAYLYVVGEWPSHHIDHINGKRDDNRWENLRNVTRSLNVANINTPVKTKSGYRGVYANSGKWQAKFRKKSLGYFDTPELAHEAYWRARNAVLGNRDQTDPGED